jgi:hypothetical protein
MLRRKCGCGEAAHQDGECEGCRKKKEQALHRCACGSPSVTRVPAIVHDVLVQPGHPLEPDVRSQMESRFGHDLSGVRVHDGGAAAASARAVDALAYTVGRDIVFARGQYRPASPEGRRLLAHELVHAVAHGGSGGRPEVVAPANDDTEIEAEQLAARLTGSAETVPSRPAPPALRRTLKVEKPATAIPNPTGKGVVQTNGDTIQQYLTTISPEGHPKVDPASGDVTMSKAACGGYPGSIAAGAEEGYRIGHLIGSVGDRIPGLGVVTGTIGGGIGALVGAVGGLIPSSTPTGSSCLCDMVASKNSWRILVDDVNWPGTKPDDQAKADGKVPGGSGGVVTAPSPNSPRLWGAGTVSGKALDVDAWLVLGHELCGHGWLMNSGSHAPDDVARRGEGGHQATVARENALRAEHGIELRATFKQPNCGESYWRDRTNPTTVNWSSARSLCEDWRKQYNAAHKTSYTITDTIP